jgi:hypothetical protein
MNRLPPWPLRTSLPQLRGPKTLADSLIYLPSFKFTNNSVNQQGGELPGADVI